MTTNIINKNRVNSRFMLNLSPLPYFSIVIRFIPVELATTNLTGHPFILMT